MKTNRYILFAILVLALGSWLLIPIAHADDYIDDIYYTPEQALQSKLNDKDIQPTYNKNVREIVFIEDTLSQPSDTIVRAIIRDKQ